MPDDQTGTITVEENQPSAIPTENQTAEVSEPEGLPEDTSERTKEQFDKLTEHNRQLAEENRQLKESKQVNNTSVFDDFRVQEPAQPVVAPPPATQFPGLNQAQVNDVFGQLVDKDGYIDQKILVDTLKDLQQQAKNAQEEAKRTRQEYERIQENEQVQRAHAKYPQLDPKSKEFDPNFFNAVKNELIGQMIQGDKDLTKAADKVSSWYKVEPKSNATEENAQKKQNQVRQINATGSSDSRGSVITSSADEADLIRRTRAGDTSALMERLKRVEQQ